MEEKKSLIKQLRAAVLPVKETDHFLVKGVKNIGFGLFFVLFSCVSLALIGAMMMAL